MPEQQIFDEVVSSIIKRTGNDSFVTDLFRPDHLQHPRSDTVFMSALLAAEARSGQIVEVEEFTWRKEVDSNLSLEFSDAPILRREAIITGKFKMVTGNRVFLSGHAHDCPLRKETIFFYPLTLFSSPRGEYTDFKFVVDAPWTFLFSDSRTPIQMASCLRAAIAACAVGVLFPVNKSTLCRLKKFKAGKFGGTCAVRKIKSKKFNGVFLSTFLWEWLREEAGSPFTTLAAAIQGGSESSPAENNVTFESEVGHE